MFCWQSCQEIVTFIHCWCDCKTLESCFWQFSNIYQNYRCIYSLTWNVYLHEFILDTDMHKLRNIKKIITLRNTKKTCKKLIKIVICMEGLPGRMKTWVRMRHSPVLFAIWVYDSYCFTIVMGHIAMFWRTTYVMIIYHIIWPCSRLNHLGLCRCTLWCSHNDEIA